jgi:hypothetical protein
LERAVGVRWASPVVTDLNGYLINLFVSVLFSALAVALLFDMSTKSLGMAERDALLLCLAYGWGTLIFGFDVTLWGHPTAASWVMVGLHGLLRRSRGGSVQAGLAFGAAVSVDYVAVIGLAVAGLYELLSPERRRLLGWFIAGAALPIAGLLFYQRLVFGGYLMVATFQQNPQLRAQNRIGGAFGGVSPAVLFKLLFSVYRGAFLFMPILVMCLLGGVRRWRSVGTDGGGRRLTVCCLLAVAGTLLLIATFNGWHGGGSAGPRYLIPALPFAVLLLPAFSRLARPLRWLFGALLLVSIANMAVIAATTTIVGEGDMNPLYDTLYGWAWRDPLSLAPPWAAPLFARKIACAVAVAIAMTVVVWLVTWTGRPKDVVERVRVDSFDAKRPTQV